MHRTDSCGGGRGVSEKSEEIKQKNKNRQRRQYGNCQRWGWERWKTAKQG